MSEEGFKQHEEEELYQYSHTPQEHPKEQPQEQRLYSDEPSPQQIAGRRRHRRSEINLALFLFQRSYKSYNGQFEDLREVIESTKIKQDKKWLGLNARDAQGLPILINCLKGSVSSEDESDHLECVKV